MLQQTPTFSDAGEKGERRKMKTGRKFYKMML